MKKLKLSLHAVELLQREQMKKIAGGFSWSLAGYGPPPVTRCIGNCDSGNGSDCEVDGSGSSSDCSCDQITIDGQTSTDYFCS